MDILLTIILSGSIVISFLFVLQKRRKHRIHGWSSLVSSLALYSIAILQILAYWGGFLGLVSFICTIILLMTGAYFTKYIPRGKVE